MGRTDRYLPVLVGKPPFDISASAPAQKYEACSLSCEAYPASAARANNHAGGIVLQLQDSFTTGMIFARCNTLLSAERVSVKDAETSPGLAIRIKSQPEPSDGSSGRMASRKSRLARFRSTAFPTVFPAATPTLSEVVLLFLCLATNTTSGWAYDLPVSRTRLKSSDRDSRNLLCTRTSTWRRNGLPTSPLDVFVGFYSELVAPFEAAAL